MNRQRRSRVVGRVALAAIGATVALTAGAGASAIAAPKSEDRAALKRASIPKCPAREVRADPREARRISLRCKGLNGARAEVVKGPRHGELGSVSQKKDRVRYRPDDGFTGADHLLVERERRGHVFLTSVRVEVGGGGKPDCGDHHAIARSESPVRIRIRCRGAGLEKLKLKGPRHGDVQRVRHDSSKRGDVRTLTARLSPGADFSGQDALVVAANAGQRESLGSIGVSVLPWRMRAIGDSVTAGFGFYGDGSPMQESDLVPCEPPDTPNNRCSSNSDERGNYDGPAEWSSDFGLANDISWAAQFANSIEPNGKKVTAPDMFQNLAVTGSAPSDWLTGTLESEFEGVIDENPELIAMTMGANPLLANILESSHYEFTCAPKTTVEELQECIKPVFDEAQLTDRLQQLYTKILNGAPDSNVVVLQYHLADPSLTLFKNWQIEAMIDYFRAHISNAVQDTKQALPDEASRLILIDAQVEPGNPQPDELPRFNIGLPPVSQQGWTATYDCGKAEMVDGPSHQSSSTQSELANDSSSFCAGDPWIISSDTGIHPNADGYKQFANTLANVAAANNLVPPAE